MADCLNDDNIVDSFTNLDIKVSNQKLDCDSQEMLNKIKNDYESIFSWDVKEKTGSQQNLLSNLIDKIMEKNEMFINENDDTIEFNRFHLQLIICYELFGEGKYEESLLEIKNLIYSMETKKFDTHYDQYSSVCFHIAHSTQAYILATLNDGCEEILKSIKPLSNMNRSEKAALCAIKSKVFVEYPPIGNEISLELAEQARNLNPIEVEWVNIWLKAKGRVRRFYAQFAMPDKNELEAAEILSSATNNPHKAVELAGENLKQLHSCLLTCIDFPKEFHSNTAINEIIQKLSNSKNSRIDAVLGKYYLKHEKDYEKAKEYLSRGMSGGHFSSAIQLVKVECLLQPVHKYPFVQSLKLIYEVFTSAKRRLIILSQVLMYLYFVEDNPKELMRYLKLYMDQDIDVTFKKRHLIFAYPLFRVTTGGFKPKQFLRILSSKIDEFRSSNIWVGDEKKTVLETIDKFDKMSRVKLYGNIDNQNQQNENNNMNKPYPRNQSVRGRGVNRSNNWQRTSSTYSITPNNIQHNGDDKKQDDKKYGDHRGSKECLNKNNTHVREKCYYRQHNEPRGGGSVRGPYKKQSDWNHSKNNQPNQPSSSLSSEKNNVNTSGSNYANRSNRGRIGSGRLPLLHEDYSLESTSISSEDNKLVKSNSNLNFKSKIDKSNDKLNWRGKPNKEDNNKQDRQDDSEKNTKTYCDNLFGPKRQSVGKTNWRKDTSLNKYE
ncbi:uncharacterized protein LOC126840397 isoform X2 [Adelges cooleyi]|uniref:uncharacterized protein LOC126840397 isoform X2 n=1 Tax=Adelges cooleyi TaxID=133065 RepID=UPI00218019FF|nr:uncharacterized protein LOC126840397 isoform X2 [Adelges cooleyi]